MLQRNFIEYESAMQSAFIRGAVNAVSRGRALKLVDRVIRVAERIKPHREPATNVRLKFATAQKLRAQGYIE